MQSYDDLDSLLFLFLEHAESNVVLEKVCDNHPDFEMQNIRSCLQACTCNVFVWLVNWLLCMQDLKCYCPLLRQSIWNNCLKKKKGGGGPQK